PDGKTLVSAGRDGAVRLWDVDTSKERNFFGEKARRIKTVALSPDGKNLALVFEHPKQPLAQLAPAPEGSVKILDLVSGKVQAPLKGLAGWVRAAAFSPDAKTLATTGTVFPQGFG